MKCYLALGLAVAGCSSKSQPAPPAEQALPAGIPPLATVEAGSETQPTLPKGHPPIGNKQGGMAMGGAPGPVDPKQVLSGVIQLDPKLKGSIKGSDVVFLSIRQEQEGNPGQVLAVDRFEAKEFPIAFVIDGHKAMVPGTAFAGPVIVAARVDKDGDAMTKQPGDLLGNAKSSIPAKHVVVTINTVMK